MQKLIYLLPFIFLSNLVLAQEENPVVKIEGGTYDAETGIFRDINHRTLSQYDTDLNLIYRETYRWNRDSLALLLYRKYRWKYDFDEKERRKKVLVFSGEDEQLNTEIFYEYYDNDCLKQREDIHYSQEGVPTRKYTEKFSDTDCGGRTKFIKYSWPDWMEFPQWEFDYSVAYESFGDTSIITTSYSMNDSIPLGTQIIEIYDANTKTKEILEKTLSIGDTLSIVVLHYDERGNNIKEYHYKTWSWVEDFDFIKVEPFVHERYLMEYNTKNEMTKWEKYNRHRYNDTFRLNERKVWDYTYDDDGRRIQRRTLEWKEFGFTLEHVIADYGSSEINYAYYCDNALSMITIPYSENRNSTTRYSYLYGIDCDTVSTPQIALKVFPNPSHDQLFLESEDLERSDNLLQIYDATGRLVFEDTLPERLQNHILDLSDLASGVYFLRLFGGGESTVRQIIKH